MKHNFFSTPSNAHLLQQVAHLAEFGSNVIVIEGVEGIGKTSFSHTLFAHFSSHKTASTFVHMQAGDFVDTSEFLNVLCCELGVMRKDKTNVDMGECLAALRSFVQLMIREHKLSVVIVDDADQLSADVIGAMLSVVESSAEVSFGLHFIFFAKPKFSQRIDSVSGLGLVVHDFQLQAFSQNELENFVLTRYIEAQELFEKDIVSPRSLWARSQGIPGNACLILENEIAKLKSKSASFSIFSIGSIPIVHLSVLTVLLSAVIWVFFARSSQDQKSLMVRSQQKQSEELSGLLQPESENRNAPATDILSHSLSSSPNNGAVLLTSPDGVSSKTVTPNIPSAVDNSFTANESKERGETTELGELPVSKNDNDSSKVSALDKRIAVTAPEFYESSFDLPYSKDEQYLLSLPESVYVLQILAASKIESLRSYVSRQPNKKNLYIYQGLRQSKSWYMVVLAPYESKVAAVSAIKSLPAQQASAGPWPKKISSVQSEIRSLERN